MTTETAAKKDIQKLQRAIVDGLEDVKAQDIQVFNTEHLSPLFERVIVASGTSNRQTKALAASVRDSVREFGFAKPRVEGEDNGEWIIVDCGPAVVHIMQPAIRQYYHLEDLWGEKPVRLKLGADKPVARSAPKVVEKERPASLRRSSAAKKGEEALPERARENKQPAAKKPAAKKSASRKTGKAPLKVVKVNVPKPAAKKAAAKKPAVKTAVKTAAVKKAAPRKTPAKTAKTTSARKG